MPSTSPTPTPPAGAGPRGSRAVDMHAHHWPAAMITALHEGREWFGWRGVRRDDGRLLPALGERVVPLPVPPLGDADPRVRIQRRHELRVGLEALMPAGFLWNYELPAQLAAECCRAINTEMAALQRDHPGSFRALATLPLQDTELALAEIDHCTQALGVRSFSVASSVNGRNLDDPKVVPVLDRIASLGATLSVHPPYWEKLGAERMPRYRFTTSLGPAIEAGLATASLICGGIFDRFPDARIAVSHGGGLAQLVIGRMDAVYERRPDTRTTARTPRDYIGRLYYDSLLHDPDSLRLVVGRVGAGRLLVGTDFPFDWDSEGGTANWISSLPFLSDQDTERILYRNAAEFLSLPPDVAATLGAAQPPTAGTPVE